MLKALPIHSVVLKVHRRSPSAWGLLPEKLYGIRSPSMSPLGSVNSGSGPGTDSNPPLRVAESALPPNIPKH